MIKNGLVVIGAVIVALGVGEGILWIFAPTSSVGYHAIVRQNDPGLKPEVLVTADRRGFRTLTMESARKPPRTLRVICLGASTTEQPAQSTDEIWCNLLGARLQRRFQGLRVESGAKGSGGKTALDVHDWASRHLAELEPDLVITLFGINELAWRGLPGSPRILRATEPTGFKEWVLGVSQIARRLRNLQVHTRMRRALATGEAVQWNGAQMERVRARYRAMAYEESPKRDPDPFVDFLEGMKALVELAKGLNSEVLVLTQPALWKERMSPEETARLWFPVGTPRGYVRPSTGWLTREMDRYNRSQEAMAQRLDVSYVALDRAVPRTLEMFYDDCHYTDKGSYAVAEAIYPEAERLLERAARRRRLTFGSPP